MQHTRLHVGKHRCLQIGLQDPHESLDPGKINKKDEGLMVGMTFQALYVSNFAYCYG